MFAKTFRNTLIASTLVAAGSVLANPAMAADTGSITVGGTVADTTAVVVTPETGYNNLELWGEGTASTNPEIIKVATLGVTSNSSDGVTLTATRDGGLTNTIATVEYAVLIATGTAPAAGDFAASTVNFDTDNAVSITNGSATRDLYIKYDGPAQLDAGGYTSVITVTVADN